MTLPAAEFRGVRAVLFDAGNTLQWIDHAMMADRLRAVGIDCTTDAVRDAEMRARPRLDPFVGRAPKRESDGVRQRYVNFVLEHLGVPPSARPGGVAALLPGWSDLWVATPADAVPTLTALRDRGYRIGCVSNSDGSVDRRLAEAGLAEYMECIVDSGREGVEKPDPRLFLAATDQLRLTPAECVYVGDLYSVDVVGARRAGLVPVLMDPIAAWDVDDVVCIASLAELLGLVPAVARHSSR